MAQPTVTRGSNFLLKIWDGAAYTAPCGLTNVVLNDSTNVNDIDLPDCADPTLISWLGREPQSRGVEISADGVLDTTVLDTYRAFKADSNGELCRIELANVSLANGGGYWQGTFHLTQLQITGQRGQKVQVSLSLVSDGEVTWTNAAA